MNIQYQISIIALILFLFIDTHPIYSENITPTSNSNNIMRYDILSPIGENILTKIKQPARLNTLNGKTIALVGNSFMADITHPELKKLILQHYPKSKVLLLKEIGLAGRWYNTNDNHKQRDDFIENLKKLNIDAVIAGNGGDELSTIEEMGSCIASESIGIPSVMITTPAFSKTAKQVALSAGIAIQRVVEYPTEFTTKENIVKNTRTILWAKIVKALKTPFTPGELKNNPFKADKPIFSGTLEEVRCYLQENGWSNNLSIVPPTLEKVKPFLQYTNKKPNDVIAEISISQKKVTPLLVAINAVMADCRAEFMPILIALVKAMNNDEFFSILTSTKDFIPYCWINGPIARQLNFEYEEKGIPNLNALKIGRFISLFLLNFCDYQVKNNIDSDPMCLVENEKETITFKWKPYHIQQGYTINDNVITMSSALCWDHHWSSITTNSQKILETIVLDIIDKKQFTLDNGIPFVDYTILMTSFVARNLSNDYTSKESLENALVTTANRMASDKNYFQNYELYKVNNQQENQPKNVIDSIPVMNAENNAILITKMSTQNKTMCIPDCGKSSMLIELPKKWDQLVSKLGYEPLESFYIECNFTSPKQEAKSSRSTSSYSESTTSYSESYKYSERNSYPLSPVNLWSIYSIRKRHPRPPFPPKPFSKKHHNHPRPPFPPKPFPPAPFPKK